MSIQRPGLVTRNVHLSLLIKICTTASKFYSFLRTSISIYRKKWKSAVYGEPSWAGKTFPSPPHRGGKKCCRRVSGCTYSYVREKFSVLRVGGGGGRWTHARLCRRRADVTVLLRTLLSMQGLCATSCSNYAAYVKALMIFLLHYFSSCYFIFKLQ